MNGKSGFRGSGGATLSILKATADGFESLGYIKVVNESIHALNSVNNGFRDLLVTVRGGGDEVAVMESVPARRFSTYQECNSETKPSGKIRQIQYKLHQGESGWPLDPEQVVVF